MVEPQVSTFLLVITTVLWPCHLNSSVALCNLWLEEAIGNIPRTQSIFQFYFFNQKREDSQTVNIILKIVKTDGNVILFRTIKKVLYYVPIHTLYRKFQGECLFSKWSLVGLLNPINSNHQWKTSARMNEIRRIEEMSKIVVLLFLIQLVFVLWEFEI